MSIEKPLRAAPLSILVLVLCGCLPQLIPESAPPPSTYDFGPPPEQRSAPLPVPFRLESVSAPSWLETTSIYYRRLDEQPSALRSYARNEWIAAPSELFAERLSYRLAGAAPEGDEEALAVRLEIVRFEHVYSSPSDAYVVALARASYEDLDGRLHRLELERRRSAAAAVDGATAALPRVADDLIDELLDRLREVTAARQ